MRFYKMFKKLKKHWFRESEPGEDGMFATLGGDAHAVGDATAASGRASLKAVETKKFSKITGHADFSASARDVDGDGVVDIGASTYFDAVGADIIFIRNKVATDIQDAAASVRAKMKVTALEIPGFEPIGGPLVIDLSHFGRGHKLASPIVGHVAEANAAASAEGDDTLSTVETFAQTGVEGYSVVAAQASVGIA